MGMRRGFVSAVFLALLTGAAGAQQKDQCYDYVGTMVNGAQTYNQILNMVQTDRWRESQILNQPDTQSKLAGLWYGQIYSPQGDMVQNLYLSFEPNGLFQYQDQTCPTRMAANCSQNYGTGEWTARTMQDGTYAVMYHFSDLNRGSACNGILGRLQGAMLYGSDGIAYQRVR